MRKRSREMINALKEDLGIAQYEEVNDGNSADGTSEIFTEMPQEEAEEYLKLKNAANLDSIRSLLTYIAVILSLPVAALVVYVVLMFI